METHKTHDTWIAKVPFPDGTDRRESPRVPCALRVRLGPPKAPVETTLVAEDVSIGGLFIRCRDEVQVGARFSIELDLADGAPLYVAEAEVLYNFAGGEGEKRGFGARFVSLTHDALERLESAAVFASDIEGRAPRSGVPATNSMIIDAQTDLPPSRINRRVAIDLRSPARRLPEMPQVSDLRLATLRPLGVEVAAATAEMEVLPRPEAVQDTAPPARPLFDDVTPDQRAIQTDRLCSNEDEPAPAEAIRSDDSLRPSEVELQQGEDMHDGIDWKPREVRARERGMHRWSRRVSAAVGSRAMLWLSAAVAGVSVVMVGAALIGAGGSQSAASPTPPELRARVSGETQRVLTGNDAKLVGVEPVKATAPVEGQPAKNPLPPLVVIDRGDPAAMGLPASTLPARPSADRVAPARPSSDRVAPARPSSDRVAPAPASKSKGVVAPKSDARSAGGGMSLALDKGAKVLRTHVLKQPDRFVIDLIGQKAPPAVLGKRGDLGAPRVGLHPDYVRVVIDSPAHIQRGEVSVRGERLELTLSY
ncbi:MAG: PilZ domain-containing protein [Deltaproteobacteria bacterium]|nr:PilZ domain-containing protein [Deltaproteobacteria bacterium]